MQTPTTIQPHQKKSFLLFAKVIKQKKLVFLERMVQKIFLTRQLDKKPCQDPLESGNDFVTRLMNEQYPDSWSGNAVRKTEYSQLRKYADRSF